MRETVVIRLLSGLVVLALTGLMGLGCSFGEIHPKDPFNRKYSLQEAQHAYTAYVRWSKFKEASIWVHEETREDFLAEAPSMKKLRFTDYEIGSIDIDPETGESTIEVTYTAYQPFSPIEIEIVETQQWARDDITNSWKVKSSFDGLEQVIVRDDR